MSDTTSDADGVAPKMNECPPAEMPAERSPRSFLTTLAVIAALLCGVLWLARAFQTPETHPAAGKKLAVVDLQVLTGEGEPVSTDDLQGRVALINFWGPWCQPCMWELPQMIALQEKYAQREDLHVLLVSCSPSWTPQLPPPLEWREDIAKLKSETQRTLQQQKADVATYADEHGRTRDAYAAAAGGWSGYPTTLLLDKHGVIRQVWIGYIPGREKAIEDRIRQLLDE